MKGFMRKRGESWELRVCLGNDPVTGKQRDATVKETRGVIDRNLLPHIGSGPNLMTGAEHQIARSACVLNG